MYSPHSDLYKMFHTPDFILFRVKIKGSEHFGRVDTINTQIPYKQQPVSGTFITFDGQNGFEAGIPVSIIPVDAATVEGIEAIDILNPAPLNAILAACNEIDEITQTKSAADIGLIRYEIPVYIEDLLAAMLEFEQLHDLKHNEKIHADIEAIRKQLSSSPDNATELERKKVLTECRETIAACVSTFIELAAFPTNNKETL